MPDIAKKEVIYVPVYPGMMDSEDDEIDLLQLWRVVWNAKFFIASFTIAATLAAVLVTLYVLPVTYKSEAVLLPTESESGKLGGLASLAGSLPIPISLPGGGKSDQILTFLQSRNLQQRLIEKYELLPHYYAELWDTEKKAWKSVDSKSNPSVVKALQGNLLGAVYNVSQNKKNNLISVSWVDEDPVFAAAMLKRVIADLAYYLDNEFEFDAKREREFVEAQLTKAVNELEYWEKQVPNQNLTLAIIQRERLATQAVYTELRKQVELAKINEAKELVRFKVLDPPFVPEQKFKPKRSLICILTMVTSGFLAVFLVFMRRALAGMSDRGGAHA